MVFRTQLNNIVQYRQLCFVYGQNKGYNLFQNMLKKRGAPPTTNVYNFALAFDYSNGQLTMSSLKGNITDAELETLYDDLMARVNDTSPLNPVRLICNTTHEHTFTANALSITDAECMNRIKAIVSDLDVLSFDIQHRDGKVIVSFRSNSSILDANVTHIKEILLQ